jgi:hypothetical protein
VSQRYQERQWRTASWSTRSRTATPLSARSTPNAGQGRPGSCRVTLHGMVVVSKPTIAGDRASIGAARWHQIKNLVLRSGVGGRATWCQTSCLATIARNCDQIATRPLLTGGDERSAWSSDMAVDQEQGGHQGNRRTDREGRCKTTDLAVGGSNPSLCAAKPEVSRILLAARRDCSDHDPPELAACRRPAGSEPVQALEEHV